MRKFLFLDVDGVLNSREFLAALPKPEGLISVEDHQILGDMIDPKRVEKLNLLVARIDIRIVLSSSWRLSMTLEQFETLLTARGYVGPALHDVTPHCKGHERHVEIKRWLQQQFGEPRFAILDDDRDASVGLEYHFIHVENGLEDRHVEKARRLLADER